MSVNNNSGNSFFLVDRKLFLGKTIYSVRTHHSMFMYVIDVGGFVFYWLTFVGKSENGQY